MASIGDVFAMVDDRVIRLRAEGLTYRQIADHFGWVHPSSAQVRNRAARGRQIPRELRPRTLPKPDLPVVAWAAGFFDGEGCVYGYEGVQNGGYRRFTFGVTVSQVVAAPLLELKNLWGGSIRELQPRNPRHAYQWHWGIRGSDAGFFLQDILPFLRVKRVAAEAALPCLLTVHGHGQPFTSEEVALRRHAVAVLRGENRKGRRPVGEVV